MIHEHSSANPHHYWQRAGTVLNWEYSLPQAGSFTLEADIASAAPANLGYTAGKSKGTARLPATGSLDTYRTVRLGTVVATAAGDYTLELRSIGADWPEVRLRAARLVPAR